LQSPEASERISAANQKVQLKEGTYASLMDQYEQARLRETIRANTISVVEPAGLPRSPFKPRKALNIGLGFLVGIIGGVALAFLFENLGRKLYTSEQIEAVTELTPLGKIPHANPKALSAFSWGSEQPWRPGTGK
jgi:capsular polysaccharide biosynthesis protein